MTIEANGMTTMQEILAKDFNEKIPTLKQIIDNCPPAEEIIEGKDGNTLKMMISRSKIEAKTILYAVPLTQWSSVKERLDKGLSH